MYEYREIYEYLEIYNTHLYIYTQLKMCLATATHIFN